MSHIAQENSNGQSSLKEVRPILPEGEVPEEAPVDTQYSHTDSAAPNLAIPVVAHPESSTSSFLQRTERFIAQGMTLFIAGIGGPLVRTLVGPPSAAEHATQLASHEQLPAPDLPLTQRETIIAHTRMLAEVEEPGLKAIMAPVPEAFAKIYRKLDHVHEAQNEDLARRQKAEELRTSTLLTVATDMFEHNIVTLDDLDLNKDGTISTHEITTFIGVLGQVCSPHDLQHLAEAQDAYQHNSEALSRAAIPVGHNSSNTTNLERQEVRALHRAHEAFLESERLYTNQLHQIARRVFEPAEAPKDVIYLPPRQPVQERKWRPFGGKK